jgi:4-aminobutyrate aminotransferase-like enzyme/Ser/Thr protein kinase RdoA (MazF antagonist)
MNRPSVLRHRPAFTAARVEEIARESWGIESKATMLPGERDQNVLLEAPDGTCSVLKIANALDDRPLVEAQNEAMARVAAAARPGPTGCPIAIPAVTGEEIVEVEGDAGLLWLVRRITWLDGHPLAEVRYRPPTLLRAVGRRVAEVGRALDGFDHPATHRTLDWDPLHALGVIRNGLTLIADPEMVGIVRDIAERFERTVQPGIDALPKAVIHADANDFNIIVGPADRRTGERAIVGIIDFGDIIHSCRVADPAITIAYAMLDSPDPLRIARTILSGCTGIAALTDGEIAALWGMSCMRLCVSACLAAKHRAEQPDDDYLMISQAAIARTLPALAAIPFGLAEAHLRHACGLEPSVAGERVRAWLRNSPGTGARVVDGPVGPGDCAVFDLSVASPLIDGDPAGNEEPALTSRLNARLDSMGARVGIARWDEARLLNTGSAYVTSLMETAGRTVHLGEDLYAAEGTPVLAALDGTVIAFNDNDSPQDYGPVVILRHTTDDGTPFHTLYGHLSRSSLVGLFEGRAIERGERIGAIGGAAVNGGWTPHLHFQVIVELFGMGTAFPGICRAGEREIWKALSPDPDLILRLVPTAAGDTDATATLAAARRTAEAMRAAHVGPNLSLAYRDPLHPVRGWMQYLYDGTGRRFLDAYNNVPHIGHCHPAVVDAGARQMALLNTNTRYVNRLLGEFAERLAATLPEPLEVVWLVNSASEANELALRMASAHTGRRTTIVLEHAYHGNTTTLIDISPYKHDGPGGSGAPDWVRTAPMPDTYRGEFRRSDADAGERYAASVAGIVAALRSQGDAPAAFIAETCPSVGGQIMLPAGYLSAVYKTVRRAGGVCIADEVQTAYGRTGSHFYAFEAHGVVPDIVVLGKPIGNGHPIGAVITTREIARSFDNGMEFFSTFGGNTVSCAIGLAVLDVMEDERLMDHARTVGDTLLDRLRRLAGRFPLVGDVRGSGLFLGVELVRDRDTLEPAGDEAAFICDRMRDRGILIGTDGPWHNVLKIRPPMPFDEANAEALAAALELSLREIG